MTFLLLVTVTSMLLAAAMSLIAWRIAGAERRRSDARVAALAAAIHGVERVAPRDVSGRSTLNEEQIAEHGARTGFQRGSRVGDPMARRDDREYREYLREEQRSQPVWPAREVVLDQRGQATSDDLELRPRRNVSTGADLFTAAHARPGSRWPAIVAAGVFVLAAAAALVVVLSGGSSGTTHASNQPPAAAPSPVAELPLELVALGHERDGDRLTVRGIVRNPESGAAVDRLTAVVFLFNRDGGFLSSGRVPVESSALRPGTESTFVVTVPGAGDVDRYRVSFRTDDRIVPHVDRRAAAQAKL